MFTVLSGMASNPFFHSPRATHAAAFFLDTGVFFFAAAPRVKMTAIASMIITFRFMLTGSFRSVNVFCFSFIIVLSVICLYPFSVCSLVLSGICLFFFIAMG